MPVDDSPLRNEAGLIIDEKTQPQRVILGVMVALVEKTDLVPSLTIDTDRNTADVIAIEQCGYLQPGKGQRPPQIVLFASPTRLEKQPEIRIKKIHARITFDPPAIEGKLGTLKQVVRAEPMNPIAARLEKRGIQRRCNTAIGLMHHPDPRIVGSIGINHRAGSIRRAVV